MRARARPARLRAGRRPPGRALTAAAAAPRRPQPACRSAGLYSVKFMYTGDVDRNISHELGLAVEVDAVVVCLVAFSFNVSQLLWIFSFLQGLAAPLRST